MYEGLWMLVSYVSRGSGSGSGSGSGIRSYPPRPPPIDCWHEARVVPVYTPIHEFEAALLLALDAAGTPVLHRNASIHMLHGVVGEGELLTLPLLAHQDPDFYRNRAYPLNDHIGTISKEDPLWGFSGGGPWPRGELKNGEEGWSEDELKKYFNSVKRL